MSQFDDSHDDQHAQGHVKSEDPRVTQHDLDGHRGEKNRTHGGRPPRAAAGLPLKDSGHDNHHPGDPRYGGVRLVHGQKVVMAGEESAGEHRFAVMATRNPHFGHARDLVVAILGRCHTGA
jgi:hypothetical protein